jgi:hypothetical protein
MGKFKKRTPQYKGEFLHVPTKSGRVKSVISILNSHNNLKIRK